MGLAGLDDRRHRRQQQSMPWLVLPVGLPPIADVQYHHLSLVSAWSLPVGNLQSPTALDASGVGVAVRLRSPTRSAISSSDDKVRTLMLHSLYLIRARLY